MTLQQYKARKKCTQHQITVSNFYVFITWPNKGYLSEMEALPHVSDSQTWLTDMGLIWNTRVSNIRCLFKLLNPLFSLKSIWDLLFRFASNSFRKISFFALKNNCQIKLTYKNMLFQSVLSFFQCFWQQQTNLLFNNTIVNW